VETNFFVGSVEEISMSCTLETCNVQCNRALICTLIMCFYILLLYHFNNIGLQVSPTYKSQHRRFLLINRDVPCNMILMGCSPLSAILYNAETWRMWKTYSVPCNSTSNTFYCSVMRAARRVLQLFLLRIKSNS
jgi:hypothetical protein